jgi:hypothetical protein
MSAGVLNFPMLRGWSLAGLGGYAPVPVQQAAQIMWANTPFGTSYVIKEPDFKKNMSDLLSGGKYTFVQTSDGSVLGAVSADDAIAMLDAKNAKDNKPPLTPVARDGITTTMSNLASKGYFIIAKGGSSSNSPSPSASPATVSAIVNDATTPGDGKEPAAIDTFNAAIEIVKSMAPGIAAARQAEAAQKLLDKQAAGKQIYRRKRNWTPWIVGGVGALVVLGLVYVVTRE